MKKKLFNFNKPAKKEYTSDMLPKNRREVFFDVLKLNWTKFLLLGVVFLLVCLPLLSLSMYQEIVADSLRGEIEVATAEQQAELRAQLYAFKDICAVLKIPCIIIIALYLSGLVKVVRQYAWEEDVFHLTDFVSGFKSNAWHMFLLSLIVGVAYAISSICFNISISTSDEIQSYIMMIPTCAFVLFVLPLCAYAVTSIAVYKNKFSAVMKLSFRMIFLEPWRTYLALLCCLGLFALLLIPNFMCQIIVSVVGCLLFPVILLAWLLFSFNQFDKHVNAQRFPQLVGKGVFKQVEQNDDADEQ